MKPILALASVLMISPCFGQPPVPPPVVIPDHGHEHEPEQRPPLPPGVVMPPDLGHGGHGHHHEHGEPAAPPPVVKLALDAPPKFSTLTEAGFRFLTPGMGQPTVAAIQLRTESVAVVIGDLEPLVSPYVDIAFRREDLAEPGRYYPPIPAVGPDTPVRRLSFLATVPEGQAETVLKKLLPLLGIDAGKPEAWLKNRMWEVTNGLDVQGKVAGGESRVLLARGKESGDFGLNVFVSWGEPERQLIPSNPQKIGPRPPGARIGPQPPAPMPPAQGH